VVTIYLPLVGGKTLLFAKKLLPSLGEQRKSWVFVSMQGEGRELAKNSER